MNEPLVTVLMTVYNRENVSATVESILRQTYQNLEFLIVDNASTDRTRDVIEALNDGRIKLVVNEQNYGQTYSLNRGLCLAKGKYIARIDSDDIALPDRIEKQVHFLENNPDYCLVGSFVRYINDDDELTVEMNMPTSDLGMRVMQKIACAMYHPAAMYRRDVIVSNNIKYDPNIHMAEDYDMWRNLMHHGKALNLPEVLLYYRKGNNNDSSKHAQLMYEECFEVRKQICKEDKDIHMLRIIEIEEKHNKHVWDVVRIVLYLKKYVKRNIDNETVDYRIINRHVNYKIISTCIRFNENCFFKMIEKVYDIFRTIYYKRATRTNASGRS